MIIFPASFFFLADQPQPSVHCNTCIMLSLANWRDVALCFIWLPAAVHSCRETLYVLLEEQTRRRSKNVGTHWSIPGSMGWLCGKIAATFLTLVSDIKNFPGVRFCLWRYLPFCLSRYHPPSWDLSWPQHELHKSLFPASAHILWSHHVISLTFLESFLRTCLIILIISSL